MKNAILMTVFLGSSIVMSAADFSEKDASLKGFRQTHNRTDCAKVADNTLQVSHGGIATSQAIAAPGAKYKDKDVKKLIITMEIADSATISGIQFGFVSNDKDGVIDKVPYVRAGIIEMNSKSPCNWFLQSMSADKKQIESDIVKNDEFPLGTDFSGKNWKVKLEMDSEKVSVYFARDGANFGETPNWAYKHNQDFAKWNKGVFAAVYSDGTAGDYAKALNISKFSFDAITE